MDTEKLRETDTAEFPVPGSRDLGRLHISLSGEHAWRWWLSSAVLHLILFLLLVWLTPVRELLIPQESGPERTHLMSAERTQSLAKRLDERNEEMLRQQALELRDLAEEMMKLEQAKSGEFEAVKQEMVESAPEKALRAQEAAMEAQKTAQAEQAKAQETDSDGKRRSAQDAALRAQEEVQRAQATAEYALQMLDGVVNPDVIEAQIKARQSQEKADQAQVDTRLTERTLGGLQYHAPRAAARAEKTQRDLQGAKKQTADLGGALKALEETIAATESRQKELEQQKAEAEKAVAAAETDRAKRSASSQLKKLERDQKGTARKLKETRARLGHTAQRLAGSQASLERREAEAPALKEKSEKLSQELAETTAKAERLQAEATAAQDEASKLQADAHGKLTQAVSGGMEARASDAAQDAARAQQGESALPDSANLQEMDIAQLYENSQEMEKRVTGAYRELKATELALIREIPLEKALESTSPVKTDRPQVDAYALRGNVRTRKALEKYKDAVTTVHRETSAMVSLAQALVESARHLGGQDGQGASAALDRVAMRAGAAISAELRAAQSGGRATDLTDLMKSRSTSGGGAGGVGEESESGKKHPTTVATERPKLEAPRINKRTPLTPGRKIYSHGLSNSWMIVDSWYTIGPFANPERRNMNRRFPPESVVDLDAAYEGKDGKLLRWEFVQSAHPYINPARMETYAIYYAYTEIYSDEARDLWIAFGSDDKSTIWINDHLVWISGGAHKNWRLDEAYRKVHFRKGLNRVLYRIENGWGWCAFSLAICTKPSGRAN